MIFNADFARTGICQPLGVAAVNATVPLNRLSETASMIEFSVVPLAIERQEGRAWRLKSGFITCIEMVTERVMDPASLFPVTVIWYLPAAVADGIAIFAVVVTAWLLLSVNVAEARLHIIALLVEQDKSTAPVNLAIEYNFIVEVWVDPATATKDDGQAYMLNEGVTVLDGGVGEGLTV